MIACMTFSLSLLVAVGRRVQVPFEVVEARGPHLPVGLKPLVDRTERFGKHAVETALSLDAHVDEARLAKYAKVLGDRRLAEAEAIYELTHGSLGRNQEVEGPPAIRLGKDVERGGHRRG